MYSGLKYRVACMLGRSPYGLGGVGMPQPQAPRPATLLSRRQAARFGRRSRATCPIWQVLSQSKTVFTAGLMYVIVGKRLSLRQARGVSGTPYSPTKRDLYSDAIRMAMRSA